MASFGLEGDRGVLVLNVDASKPPALAGLQQGDVVMSVDGRAVSSAEELRADVREHWPDQTLKIVVSRAGSSFPLDITAAELSIESFFPADDGTAALLQEAA